MVQVGQMHEGYTILAVAYKRFDSRQNVIYLGESDRTYKIWHSFANTNVFPDAVLNPHYWAKSDTTDPLDIMRMFAEIVLD